ncbi:MAG: cyclic nucleotide-binding domain-containing protein [Deltaproteobacteria bacterium]|nr:cyclic nucleotide-binding domain-containing protein [Deltaproteobacteria bacterium]
MARTPSPGESTIRARETIPDIVKPLMGEKISIREFSAGESITSPGDDHDQIRFVLSGKAEVVVGYRAAQEVIVEHLGPGDVFGDLAFLTGRD